MTVKVTLNPGHGMNYHSHERRDEVWTVVSGSGRVVIDGVTRDVSAGDVIDLPVGCKHTVSASSDGLQIIEVQMGEEISVKDKKKWERCKWIELQKEWLNHSKQVLGLGR